MWTPQDWYEKARQEGQNRPSYFHDTIAMWMKSFRQELGAAPEAEVLQQVGRFHKQCMEARPALGKFPELRGVRELLEAQIRGWRDGAKLSDEEAVLHFAAWRFYQRVISTGKYQQFRAACSYVYFADSDHGPLLGNNLDTSPDEPYHAPAEPGGNEHVIIGGVSSGVPFDEESPELFPAPVFEIVRRYARTTEEAVEFLVQYNHFWGPGNQIVVDRSHRIALIEKTACRIGVRWAQDYAFITAMAQEHPETKAFVAKRRLDSLQPRGLTAPCADTAYWAAQERRLKLMNELLAEHRQRPTLRGIQSIMQFRDPQRGCVAGNGDVYLPGGPPAEHTIRTIVWRLREGKASWWARDKVRGTPSWENPQPEVELTNLIRW